MADKGVWGRSLSALFKPKIVEIVKYKIVEVERPYSSAQLDPEGKKSVRSLAGHPGFQYLLAKLKIQQAALKVELTGSRHADLRAVDFIQSGIFWAGWLETQISKDLYGTSVRPSIDPTTEEKSFLEQAKANIELVGA